MSPLLRPTRIYRRHTTGRLGKLLQVSNDNQNESIRLQLLLGRLLFDGALPTQLAERYDVSLDDVAAAWQFCQRQLSEQLANSDGSEFRLLNEDELRTRTTECLRLLLDWRDVLLTEARVHSFAMHGNAIVNDGSKRCSDRDDAETE